MLAYLVQTEAAGEGDKIKAYAIGLDVFGKPKDFDPTTDSSVRVEVGRLRTAISLFEASEYADTALVVNIPVGTYRPEITRRSIADHAPADVPPITAPRRTWLVPAIIAVLAIFLAGGYAGILSRFTATVSGPPIKLTVEDFAGGALGKELSLRVKDSFSNNSVVALLDSVPDKITDHHFVMRGNITDFNDYVWVSVELANQDTKRVVWNHFFRLDQTRDLQEELDAKLNGELKTRLIGAAKEQLENRDLSDLTPEQLFVLATWVSGPAESSLAWEVERVTLMNLALQKDPDFGPAHSVLADKYGFLANMHPDWDTPENLDLAQFHAKRAMELAPRDADAMFNVAQSYWHRGDHIASQRVFRRVTELDGSNSLAQFFAYLMPYWCGAVPDDAMNWALDFDSSLSRDDPIRWIVLTWIATLHVNRGEYNLALQATTEASQIFQVGYTYMTHAMLLNKTGRPAAAQAVLQYQLGQWPGISAAHYASATVPRLCAEQESAARFVDTYKAFAQTMETVPALP